MSLLLGAAVLTQQAGERWAYYRTVTINNAGGSAKTDWSVMVSLTSANFTFAHAKTDGTDLQFRATDGETVLPYWREAYDDGTDTSTLWVKVPSVSAGGTVDVRLYYGNPTATDGSDAGATFLVGKDFRYEGLDGALISVLETGTGFDSFPQATDRSQIAIHGGTGWRETEVREQSNAVWTGSEYVLLVSGADDSGTEDNTVGMYYTTDLEGSWTEYGPVITSAEDAYITMNVDGTLYRDIDGWAYVMYERKPGHLDVGISRTKNFRDDWESWTGSAWGDVDDHVAVLINGASGFDTDFTASPTVLHNGSEFICIYEGDDGVGPVRYSTGLATSPDGITWTKEATNPISALEVPDDVALIDGVWYLTGHSDSGNQYIYTSTETDPTAWVSGSFTLIGVGGGFYMPNGNSINFVFGPDGITPYITYQNGIGTDGIALYKWMGSSDGWYGVGPAIDPLSKASGWDGSKYIINRTSTAGATALTSPPTGKTSDIAIRTRKRSVAGYWGSLGIGSGNSLEPSGNAYRAIGEGYLFGSRDPGGVVAMSIREYTASAFTTAISFTGAAPTLVQAQTMAVHEARYRSTGALAYLYNGTSILTGLDSTYAASGDKKISITQGGNAAPNAGTTTEIEWIVARPFDGVDPSATVGSETST